MLSCKQQKPCFAIVLYFGFAFLFSLPLCLHDDKLSRMSSLSCAYYKSPHFLASLRACLQLDIYALLRTRSLISSSLLFFYVAFKTLCIYDVFKSTKRVPVRFVYSASIYVNVASFPLFVCVCLCVSISGPFLTRFKTRTWL